MKSAWDVLLTEIYPRHVNKSYMERDDETK